MEGKSHLHIINKQFSMKVELMGSLDNDILALCRVSNMDDEIGESETTIAKIIEHTYSENR